MSVTLKLTETLIMNVFRQVLLQIVPPGTPVIRTQVNRVPQPNGDDWISMTPLYRNRLSTNVDTPMDCLFLGSIDGYHLTVLNKVRGDILINSSLYGPSVLAGTTIIDYDDEAGKYIVSPVQQAGTDYMSAGVELVKESIDFCVQVDVYGSNSADNVHKIAVLLRDYWGCAAFSEITPDIQTLYADDPRQMAFINAEQQYEQRWMVDVHLQVNPVVQVPQQFADQMDITAIPVDVVIHPIP